MTITINGTTLPFTRKSLRLALCELSTPELLALRLPDLLRSVQHERTQAVYLDGEPYEAARGPVGKPVRM
jgi:hypothetical protein